MPALKLDIPDKFAFLFRPIRNKVAKGGRSSTKSWSFARALLTIGYARPTRILCTREVQNSIDESVYQLLKDQIHALGLGKHYTVYRDRIVGKNNTLIVFEGLAQHTIASLKSYEGFDICFVAGTMVDDKPIEDIKPGDMVNSFNHSTNQIELRKVLHISKTKNPQKLYRVLIKDTHCGIVSTGNHPVYVKGKGYIPVNSLKSGDIVYEKVRPTGICGMPWKVWGDDSNKHQGAKGEVPEKRWILVHRLCEEKELGKNESKQPYGQSSNKSKNAEGYQRSWVSPIRAWWKRSWIYEGANEALSSIRQRLVDGACHTDADQESGIQSSSKLQSRLSKHLLQVSNRSGRWLPYWSKKPRRGQKEKSVLREHRVDRVEILQQRDIEGLGLSDGGNYVYNLEVEVNSNYFANNLLVHNCWIEEGHAVSKRSWEVLIPTIRKEGSEIWVTFNPELETDETYKRFVTQAKGDPDYHVVHVTYRDNPFFNETMEKTRLECLHKHPEDYDNIWLGICRPAVAGAIYYNQVAEMERAGRIRPVPYDPFLKVHVVGDIGFNDSQSLGMVQKVASEIRIIDYIEDNKKTWDFYNQALRERKYNWGSLWLPHDAFAHRIEAHGKSSAEIMTALGWDVVDREDIVEISQEEGIKVARMTFPRVYIDQDKCGRLVECLKRYRRNVSKQTGAETAPVHDEYSNGADMFRYLSLNVDRFRNEDRGMRNRSQPNRRTRYSTPLDPGVGY